MANSTAKKSNTRRGARTTAGKPTPASSSKVETRDNADEETSASASVSAVDTNRPRTTTPLSAKNVDMTQYITVKNGFQGQLIYNSSRTGERFVWDEFGDEQDIELRELKNAKNSAKGYFENNWFMFGDDDMWVVDFLGVGKYYRNAVSIDHFDDIFSKTPSEIMGLVQKLSLGQKRSLAFRARQFIEDGKIDSLSVIDALEKALDIELTEK